MASSIGGRIRSLCAEPLLQFAAAGLAIFLVHRALGGNDGSDARIVLDGALVSHQRQLYQVQFGAAPDALTMESLLQRYVREEALYREGMRLHLGNGDEVIRQRIVQKMETLLADAEIIPAPTPAQLRDFHARNVARYTEPGEVSFEQLYFSIERGGGAAAQARASRALSRLDVDPAAHVDSDALAIGASFSGLDATEVARRFGATPFARAVGEAPVGKWSGPVQSGFGVHLLRVASRNPPRILPLEAVQARVREDYLAASRDAAREQRVARILGQYRVVRTDAR